jgi:signal transduction histidine kinase
VYVASVGVLGAVMQRESDLLASLLATGLVAVLFHPLRERLQRGVNRLMYGERDDPYGVILRVGQRLEAQLAPEAVLPAVAETVAHALRLSSVSIELRREGQLETVAAHGKPAGQPEAIDLSYRGELLGRMLVGPRAAGEQLSPADRRLLTDLARQVGVAAYAVGLTADLQRSRERLVTAREEERRRLRRDLHDGLGPTLAGVTMQLEAARNRVKSDPYGAEAMLATIEEQAREAVADVRSLAYDLRPPALDEFGLVRALEERAKAVTDSRGLAVSVHAAGERRELPAAVEVAAFRIAAEAVANVARHARARRCTVLLSFGTSLEVEVTDDGCGLGPGFRAGVGVSSMRERAAELGGNLLIEPLGSGGTRVSARLPLGES